jgi:colanic acid biosynthesis glycosyl transferase WcaI
MHVMFMAQCYAPEEVSAAVLITELATDLVKRGHQVTFVTGAPNYPYGRVFEGYRNRAYQVEWLDGVRVVRTWSHISPNASFWPRILHYGTYSATAFYGGLLAGKPDIVVNYSPPLPLGLSAWLLSRLWRVPWVLQLEDLYPDAAVAAGMLQNRPAIAFFAAMERFQYRQATHISLIAERAMASGIPVVATSVGGIPDLITDGENGLLVPAGQPEDLAEALARLIGDPPSRMEMGLKGRQRALQHHDLDARVPDLVRFHESVARGSWMDDPISQGGQP